MLAMRDSDLKLVTVLLATVVWTATHGNAEILSGYHVGNSLTNTALHGDWMRHHATARGHSLNIGYHIGAAQSLSFIWNNPSAVTYSSPSTFDTALPAHAWDFVTLQPYQPETKEDARAAVAKMIGLTRAYSANSNTRFYVYSAWPQNLDGTDYSVRWLEDYDGSDSRMWTRDYFTQLMTEVRADHASLPEPVYMIPVGEVLYQLDQLAHAGNLPGYNGIEELYEDAGHLRLPMGHYLAGLVVYSTVFGESPVGLWHPEGVSADLAAVIQQTAWNVISASPYTGVPEPGSSLFVVGAMGLGMLRRRRRMET